MTVLVDSSAWVEFLRATGSPEHLAVRRKLAEGVVATTDAVALELMIGPTTDQAVDRIARLLAGCRQLSQHSPSDAERAAALYRQCRRAGDTPRSVLDCLIAAVAIRHDVAVLHRARDFDVLARHTALRLASVRPRA